MAQAGDPAAYVYEGFWTNFSKGSIRGLALTLSPKDATLMSNSLALFVTLSGSQLWTIIRFIIHQLRASPGPQDSREDHNQQQVILRNTTTDLATMQLMLSLAWASPRSGRTAFSRSVLIALVALIHAILFVIAGAFSSTVLSAGPNVLLRSKHCGTWNDTYYTIAIAGGVNPTSAENFGLSVQYLANLEHNVQLSREYTQKCYQDQPPNYLASICNSNQKPKLSFKNFTGECPFELQICDGTSGAIVFDTGPIDSHDDLGINAPYDERLTYRRMTTCAVLNGTGHTGGWDGSNDTASDGFNDGPTEYAYVYYGPSLDKNSEYTYSYSSFASFYANYTAAATIPYQLYAELAYGLVPEAQNPSKGGFVPLPELKQDSADLTLLFLSYTGKYVEPIEDPWFSANRLHLVDSQFPLVRTQYSPDSPIGTVGCTEQHKFCTGSGNCTPFLGFDQVQHVDSFNQALTPHQNVTFDRILRAVDASNILQIVRPLSLTSTPILAVNQSATQIHTLSLKLPKNQWQLELDNWHSIAMAQLQQTIVQWGTGQIAAEPQFLVAPQTEPDSWFCRNLMIRSTVYQSFSVLAIVLIVVFGLLVIVISFTIENCLGSVQGRSGRGLARREYWNRDEMLRLLWWMSASPIQPPPPPKEVSTSKHHKSEKTFKYI